jgi:hypothetical protein
MKFDFTSSLPIIAGTALLILFRRLDLLLIVAPLSVLVSVLAAKGGNPGQRKL